ncbi:MFS transporter [Phaeovulum sp. NW3]|uniref:MFS transporter n=1 Tax=Phaeovulum sp. NW3 TaxID=2934933 RepID=UPI002020DE53|nr:MFS transporter [Phaeovulum sp. NW3]MCL7465360.1 MFS transporter [Phaeovulum sp. NW3]
MTQAPSRHAVTFVLVAVFLDMVGFGLVIPVLPRLIGEVGQMGLAQAALIGGWMFAAFSLAQFACAPLMGNLSDRFGRRPLLLLAIGGLGLDYLFHAFAPSIGWLFVGRVIAGICGASHVIAAAFLADVTPPEGRARAFGLMGAAFGLGFVLGPAIGGMLGELGPRVPFYAAAAISGLNLIYGLIVLPETLPPEKRRPFRLAQANPFGALRVFMRYRGVVPMAAVGYGLAGGLWAVLVLLVIHGPEGFVHPMLTALMSRAVPEDAQGALQGGLAAATNLALLAGTVFFAQVFGYFLSPEAPVTSPDIAFFIAAVVLAGALALFVIAVPRDIAKE